MPNRRLQRSILFSVVAVGVICLAVGAPIVGFVSFAYDFRKSVKEFPQRHREVTHSINRIYAHFQRHGRWPTPGQAAHMADRMAGDNLDCGARCLKSAEPRPHPVALL